METELVYFIKRPRRPIGRRGLSFFIIYLHRTRRTIFTIRATMRRNTNTPPKGTEPLSPPTAGEAVRGRFVNRPYIRFSKLRIRRSSRGFQVRHARVVEDADPYEAEG